MNAATSASDARPIIIATPSAPLRATSSNRSSRRRAPATPATTAHTAATRAANSAAVPTSAPVMRATPSRADGAFVDRAQRDRQSVNDDAQQEDLPLRL